MIRLIAIMLMLCAGINIQAQSKHDANWVFGYDCGIDFSDTANIVQYATRANNWYSTASYSSSYGDLLMYIYHQIPPQSVYNDNYYAYNSNGIAVSQQNLNSYAANASSAIFIEVGKKIYLFHVGKFKEFNTCTMPYWQCIKLYYTVFEYNSLQDITLKSANNLLIDDTINVSITATKHANGKDWWVLAHEQSGLTPYRCNNNFYKLLVKEDTIIGPTKQSIGSLACNDLNDLGEIRFSRSGKRLASILPGSGVVQLLNFDRCTGELSNHVVIDSNINIRPGFCEFSPDEDLLYTAEGYISSATNISLITQYNLSNLQSYILYDTINFNCVIGNISLAPDNRIYITSKNGSSIVDSSECTKNLSVIHYPDSVGTACGLSMFSYPLIAGCKSSFSLPKMPNYNLGALSIYEADAGRDTVLCIDSTINQKVVVLGSPPISGVQYQWSPNYNLSSDTVAQPLAYPDSTTFYVVTLTDTSIKNSCQSRQDTVWVRVENCLSVAEKYLQKENKYYLYPNPTSEGTGAIIELPHGTSGYIELWSMEGKQAGRHEIKGGKNQINLKGLGNGMYYYRVWIDNSINNTQKLILIN